MTDWAVEPSGAAEHLLNDPLLNEIFDALETDATERGLSAKLPDHDTRLYASMEVEAIRSVRRKLAEKASGKVKPKRTDPAA
tara:strand:+ start:1724 stop:1969 length:246 start_codon:yes stop_codon:yes gene_type:complete